MNDMRQQQYQTGDAVVEHDLRARELAAAKARPLEKGHLEKFKADATELNEVLGRWKNAGHAYSLVSMDLAKIEEEAKKLAEEGIDVAVRRHTAGPRVRG